MKKNKLSKQEIRTSLLAILIEINRVSKILGIKFFLNYGTLLGAIRHQGFIPWDDDVDLGLLREDYEILIANFNKLANKRYKLIHYTNTPNYVWPFAKIIDTYTSLKEYTLKPNCEYGLYVDLFVLDYVNFKTEEEKCAYENKVIEFNRKMMITDFKYAPNFRKIYNIWIMLKYKGKQKIKLLFANPMANLQEWDTFLKNYTQGQPSKYVLPVFATYPSHNIIENMLETKWFKDLDETNFEGIKLPIPSEYKKLLTIYYGNYMELPPVKKRKGDHYKSVVWKQ